MIMGDLMTETFIDEIQRRGGETDIVGKFGEVDLKVTSEHEGLAVLHCEGWRQYSVAFGARYAALSYLCGIDDNGPWAVRIPGTIEAVWEAAEWIEPLEVLRARRANRRVRRQGDVYAIEMKRDRTLESSKNLDDSHCWNPRTRYLTHHPTDGRKHRPLRVSFPAKFVQQRALAMGRSGRYANGD